MLLREKYKLALQEIFATAAVPLEIWAYGSRVKGTAHNGSDLDLVARGEDLKPIPYDVMTDLIEKIRHSNIPILVELRDWTRLPLSFHHNILKRYEVLFSNLPLPKND